MDAALRAIEMTATVDEQQQLHLDEPLPIAGPSRVRVIILVPDDADVNERQWLRAAASNPAVDFLKDPREDLYALADGRPFNDPG
jgi:hypothetical protein